DFEMLVVGDGCTDDSESIVASMNDPRVRWINLPANTGHQSGPNNEGLRQARGEIIAYLGHDDLWFPEHLSGLVAAIDGGADYAASLAGIVDPSGTVSAFRPRTPPKWILPTALAHRASVTKAIGGWKHRRDIPDSYPENELVERIRDHGYRFV